jgi:hypothetical protein
MRMKLLRINLRRKSRKSRKTRTTKEEEGVLNHKDQTLDRINTTKKTCLKRLVEQKDQVLTTHLSEE